MGYGLGIDVGTTFTAAAIFRDRNLEIFPLATYQVAVPSVIFAEGDEILFGGPAERRGAVQPLGLAREFKRRLGDPVPLMLSGSPYHADRLTALMARWVLDTVTEQVGSAPSQVVMTHPANWTEYQLGVLRNALADVGLRSTELISEPAAAALDFGAVGQVAPGASILVYDLGGGTFDVALLRKEGDVFEHQIEPSGIERLGGIDFDEAVFQYVRATVPVDVLDAARQHPEGQSAIAQLRRRCVDAKEALSSDSTADVPVMLPGYTATVRITRAEFESMIRPMVDQTIRLLESTLQRAGMGPADLGAVLLVGGSSRIPLVPQMVAEQLDLPVRVDAHPKLVVARGAARRSGLARAPASARRPAPAPGTAPRPAPSRPATPPDADDGDGDGSGGILPKALAAVVALAVVGAGVWWFALRDDDGGTASPSSSTAAATVGPETTATGTTVTGGSVVPVADSVPTGSTEVPTRPIAWRVPTGAPMASVRGPAIADGSVVFGSQDGSVYRVAAADGTVEWQQQVSDLVFSSPVVADGVVYTGGSDGVVALDLADGATRWTAAAGAAARSSPTVVDDVVYVGSDDTNLYALDATTGAVRWQTPLGGAVLSSPAVSDGIVYVGSFDGSVYALDATSGAVIWQVPLGGEVWSSPAVDGDTVYIGGNDRFLHALDKATGEERWRFATSDVVSSSPAVRDGIVYVGSFDGRVYAVDAAIGGERWRFDTGNVVFSSPRLVGDDLYIGSHSGSMYALRADDGSLQWQVRTGAIVGTTANADDTHVYFGSDDGTFYAVER